MPHNSLTPSPELRRHALCSRLGERGQSITEFALVLPVAVVILAVAATGGQMLVAAIDLTQAARAGAAAGQAYYDNHPAPVSISAESLAACRAVYAQMGLNTADCTTPPPTPPVGVSVANHTDATTGLPVIQVNVNQQIDPFLPVFGKGITIPAEASAGG